MNLDALTKVAARMNQPAVLAALMSRKASFLMVCASDILIGALQASHQVLLAHKVEQGD